MSYFIDQDFYKAGLPAWFALEQDFTAAATDPSIPMIQKCEAMSRCLDEMTALVADRQEEEPECVFWLLDEAFRFVSESDQHMARGALDNAFPSECAGVPSLPYRGLVRRLDQFQHDLEQRKSAESFRF